MKTSIILYRFAEGGGVTQPSQIRYVKYFETIFRKRHMTPTVLKINSLVFQGVPKLNSDGSFRPYIEIWNVKKLKMVMI